MPNALYHTVHEPLAGGGQNLNVQTASATVSSGFPAGTIGVRLYALAPCYVDFGASASAGAAFYLGASAAEYFRTSANATLSAIIASGAAGILNIKPVVQSTEASSLIRD